jgi:hypothetical protein
VDYLAEGGEELGVVPAEVGVEALVGVYVPRYSPTISMVKTSESESSGKGRAGATTSSPRADRR